MNISLTGMSYREALETLKGNAKESEHNEGIKNINEKAYRTLEMLIDMQYFMGYNLELLTIYGDLLERNEITPEQLKNSNENIKFGYNLAIEEQKKQFDKIKNDFKKE